MWLATELKENSWVPLGHQVQGTRSQDSSTHAGAKANTPLESMLQAPRPFLYRLRSTKYELAIMTYVETKQYHEERQKK